MTDADSGPADGFVDVGLPLSPAQASLLETELERRGVAIRLRICGRDAEGRDRQAVQVSAADLEAAMAARLALFPPPPVPETPPRPRSNRLRNAVIAGVIGLVASLRVVRLVRVPKGSPTVLVVLGVAASLFAAGFTLTKDPPGGGP